MKSLLEGGPMHGVRELPDDLRGFALTWSGGAGHYIEVGKTEAGLRLFKWKES